jgi:hypothetical protein
MPPRASRRISFRSLSTSVVFPDSDNPIF